NNGHDAFGTGGNYGYTIIAQQNSKVTAYNNFINLPASSTTRAYGLGLGNGSTNLISAHDNSILMNGNTDPDSRLAINPGTGTIDATCNWWGTGVCAGDVANIQGVVGVYPFLTSGVDSDGAIGFQPVAGACNEPSITGSVTGPSGTISMVSANSYTMAICSGQEVTPGLAGVVNSEAANCASLRVQTVYTTTISTLPPTQTVDVPFSIASTIPQPAITPENHDGVAKDIVFVSTPYYDVNGNGVYDAGVDVAGGQITFTLTVQPMPKISNTVTAVDGYNQTMTSGGTYTHTICHDVDMTTSVPTLVTDPRATECGTLRVKTQYISTLPNIPSNTIDVTFDQAVLGGPQTISPENHTGTPQTITFITTPYYDVNGNGVYDAGDVAGDVTTFVLTVQPKPELTCPGNIAVTNDAGLCSADVTYTAPAFTDYCPTTSIVQTTGLASGSAFPVGVTTNTFVITDGSGHTSTCSFTVTVEDNELPTYTIPGGGGSIAGYTCGTSYTFNTDALSCNSLQTIAKPNWADNCGITSFTAVTDNMTIVQDYGGSFYQVNFPTGTTVFTMKASDAAGNETTCALTFTVEDHVAPILQNMPADVTITAPYGNCTMNYSWLPPVPWDNCTGSVTLTSTHTPPFTFTVGTTTTITYTATDGSGNSSSASFTVTVDGTCIPAVELKTASSIPPAGEVFTSGDQKSVVITVENIGTNDSHELLPIGNVKVLVGYPSTNIFTSAFGAGVGDNDDWDVTNYGTGMALFTLKSGKVIAAGASKMITIDFTAVGFAGQDGKVTAHLYTGSGGDVNNSNNYTDGALKIN
ncbi:MAG: HYR domain-containing protein, partial [Chitinophagales bacterium]|nr:HYR domain-containing protein [Chitinophagales bacterium]